MLRTSASRFNGLLFTAPMKAVETAIVAIVLAYTGLKAGVNESNAVVYSANRLSA
jgi:hypothetical protein